MKVLLLGSTGAIGRCVLRRAQRDLSTVDLTLLVRCEEKLEGLLDKASKQLIQVDLDVMIRD